MALAVFLYLAGLAATWLPRRVPLAPFDHGLKTMGWSGDRRGPAWVGPICVALLVGGMAALTVLAFELLERLPPITNDGLH